MIVEISKGIEGTKITLSVDDMSVVNWWVDASYTVHEDWWVQTGAMMSLGKEALSSFSTKQKRNIMIFTEVN